MHLGFLHTKDLFVLSFLRYTLKVRTEKKHNVKVSRWICGKKNSVSDQELFIKTILIECSGSESLTVSLLPDAA